MTKSKYPPILFNTEMVQAILENRKKQTRRANNHPYFSKEELLEHTLPKYQIGDILWVRETFKVAIREYPGKNIPSEKIFLYKATYEPGIILGKIKWEPSIYMPKEAARIFLEVTNVRLERLQDISESDAIAEGFGKIINTQFEHPGWFVNHLNKHHMFCAVDSFASMWVKLYGTGSWKQNPFVWVYDFERINKPADF